MFAADLRSAVPHLSERRLGVMLPIRPDSATNGIAGAKRHETGIVWGPTLAGKLLAFKIPNRVDYRGTFYQAYTGKMWIWNVYETAAHFGIFWFVFQVGLDMDLSLLKRTAKRTVVIAVAGIVLPFGVATGFAFLYRDGFYADAQVGKHYQYLLFVGLLLATTSLPVLGRIISELKLLNTDFGRIAFCAAMINDVLAWSVLPFLLPGMGLEPNSVSNATPANRCGKIIVSIVVLGGICGFCVRPAVWLIQRHTPEGERVGKSHLSLILSGIMFCGFLSDAIGIHFLFGNFIIGLAIPSGPVATSISGLLEDFTNSTFLPLYFTLGGVTTDYTGLFSRSAQASGPSTAMVIIPLLVGVVKIGGTALASLSMSMPLNEALSMGFIMNSKSLLEILVLDIGSPDGPLLLASKTSQPVFQPASFVLLLIEFFLMTLLVTPTVSLLLKSSKLRPLIGYKRRNLQRSKPDSELRMVTCIHNGRNIPAALSLLEISNPTKRSPIFVYALHLVELTSHTSAMVIHHGSASDRSSKGSKYGYSNSEYIISAFESYEQHAGGVTVQALTAIAEFTTMEEDVCAVAGDKRAAIVILPFHKQLAVDGTMEEIHPAIRGLNLKILQRAPCSVGILVDRGLSGTGRYARAQHHHLAVLFFGGPDDREALAYAWRMAAHPAITITLVRFLLGDGAAAQPISSPAACEEEASRVITIATPKADMEQQLDNQYVNEFRLRYVSDQSVIYMERVVNNSEETLDAIRELNGNHDLYVVGRGQGGESPLTEGLTEWSEFPELGPIGDLLASEDFGITVSALVVQQYIGASGEAVAAPDSPGRFVQQYINTANHKAKVFNSDWPYGP